MKTYCVYDTQDNNVFVCRGTAKQLAKRFDMKPKTIQDAYSGKWRLKGKYRVFLET